MEEREIRLNHSPTKEDVEMLLTDLWRRAQHDLQMINDRNAKGDVSEIRKEFDGAVKVTHTYILDGIAQWAEVMDLGINVDLEAWAVKNLV